MRTLQTKLCQAHTHTHANKERKLRGDLSVVTLQIVLKKEKEEKEEKETKTCGVFLDSACAAVKNWVHGFTAWLLQCPRNPLTYQFRCRCRSCICRAWDLPLHTRRSRFLSAARQNRHCMEHWLPLSSQVGMTCTQSQSIMLNPKTINMARAY